MSEKIVRPGKAPRPAGPRTQAQRSARTRAKLMAAAIDCLVERGYSGTTTTEVADRAGVSRGAELHHFPSKIDLVTSAVRHLADQWLAEFHRLSEAIPREANRVSAVTDLLWSTFSGRLFTAALELWVAARTDRELFATLASTERQIGLSIRASFEEIYGDYRSAPDFRSLTRLSIHVMRGMALEAMLGADARRREEALGLWKRLASQMLQGRGEAAPRRMAHRGRRRERR